MPQSIDPASLGPALARVAAHGGEELNAKQPHWGDAILCDGLLYAAHALKAQGLAEPGCA